MNEMEYYLKVATMNVIYCIMLGILKLCSVSFDALYFHLGLLMGTLLILLYKLLTS